MRDDALIHDRNRADGEIEAISSGPWMLQDETLRDGSRSSSIVDPPIEAQKHLLHLKDALGIEYAPAAAKRSDRLLEDAEFFHPVEPVARR